MVPRALIGPTSRDRDESAASSRYRNRHLPNRPFGGGVPKRLRGRAVALRPARTRQAFQAALRSAPAGTHCSGSMPRPVPSASPLRLVSLPCGAHAPLPSCEREASRLPNTKEREEHGEEERHHHPGGPGDRGRLPTSDVRIVFVERENSPERLVCEAELVFGSGLLAGMKLVGFSLWKSPEGELYVTFPSRAFGAGSERRFFDFLRSVEGDAAPARRRARPGSRSNPGTRKARPRRAPSPAVCAERNAAGLA